MIKRTLHIPPEHLYPTDDWRIVETRLSARYFARAETAFSLSNGYLGMRGTPEEGRPVLEPGTFVNGFHETWPILHPEQAHGLARTGQTIVSVPDATVIRLYVDDEPLVLSVARLTRYERALDMREGTLTRELEWSTPAGKHVLVRSSRLVSLEHRHLAAISFEVVMGDRPAPVVLSSRVVNRQDLRESSRSRGREDPRRATPLAHRVLVSEIAEASGERLLLGYRTATSGMSLGVGVEHVVETEVPYETKLVVGGDSSEVVVTVDAQPGAPVRLVKLVAYQTSRTEPPVELVTRCSRTLDHAARVGLRALREAQRANLNRFWDRADVRVKIDPPTPRIQQAIRWNLFQVAQATWRAEGSGVPAKGLTGGAYEGHYFWDTEVYLLPFLAHTQPRIARNLLRFRHSMLPRARARARELGHRGAMFPWRTINGDEASAYYQAGTAQFHLNADIAYAVRRYVQACGDVDFLAEVGGEILVETARMWADLGFYADDGHFHIHGVTGPDEYTAVVDDNTYTNLMARLNLEFAADVLARLATERPAAHAGLIADLELAPDEPDAWRRAAAAMYVLYDERRGINPQDARFLEHERWDFENTPPEDYPLLLNYHPLVVYRRQVIKQADVVLAMFLLGDAFDEGRKQRNFDYYDALTTGDSSLSACVQSIIAAEVGQETTALEYFRFALLMDLADAQGNTSDGVHIASAAGVWQSLVFGFGGVRDYGGELSIAPRLPSMWTHLEFSLRVRQRQLRIRLTHDEERYVLDEGDPLQVRIRDRTHVLERDHPFVLSPGDIAPPIR